jgi:phosphoserine phosphatase
LHGRGGSRTVHAITHVVCLITDPERTPLDGATVAALQRALGGTARWLAEDEACELPVEGGDRRAIRVRAEAVLGNPPYDVGVVPAAGRRKRLLVSDMDSTMINVECIDELADYLGVKAQVSAVTRRAMNGELDFVAALQARVALLEGVPGRGFRASFPRAHQAHAGCTHAGSDHARLGRARGAGLRRLRAVCRTVGAASGFDITQANRLETLSGRLTGRLLGPIRSPASKLALLRQRARVLRLQPAETLAVGDGANDLPMLRDAGLGVTFRPSPAVAAVVPVVIRRGDLTALLYLQGVAKSAFVSS